MPEARLRKARTLYPELNNPNNPAAVVLARIAQANAAYDAAFVRSRSTPEWLIRQTEEDLKRRGHVQR